LWEIVGRHSSPAFLVPLSATLERLWQLLLGGTLIPQTLDSAGLFLTGLVLSIAVGMPAGLLLARVPTLRVALEPYIMVLYATPMVALIPFILSLMGFGFAPKVLVVFLFGVFPVLYNTVEGARSIKPEMIEVARSFRSGEGSDSPSAAAWSAWWRRNFFCRRTVSASSS
jgi:NitT/TauT family transport system permease protein